MTRIKAPRVVLDTNVFVSAFINRTGAPARVLEAWHDGRFTLVTTEPLVEEFAGVLRRPLFRTRYGITDAEAVTLVNLVLHRGVLVTPRRRLRIRSRDPKDDRLLAAAAGGRADYLVTGDLDLLELRGEPALGTTDIVTPRAFLESLPDTRTQP